LKNRRRIVKRKIVIILIIVVVVLAVVCSLWIWHQAQLSERSDARHEGGIAPPDGVEVKPGDTVGGSAVPNDDNADAFLPGMPEGYILTAGQIAEKKKQAESGAVADAATLEPGVHYVANEFIFEAGDEDEAVLIAAAYGCELSSFSPGWGVAKLPEGSPYTIPDLIAVSADTSNNMPPISLNLIYTTMKEVGGQG
jgi:hypothetical protein